MRPSLENCALVFPYDVTSFVMRHGAQQSLHFGRGPETLVPETVCMRRVSGLPRSPPSEITLEAGECDALSFPVPYSARVGRHFGTLLTLLRAAMSSPPFTPRSQRARRDQNPPDETSSPISSSSPAALGSSAEEGGPPRVSSGCQRRSCRAVSLRRARTGELELCPRPFSLTIPLLQCRQSKARCSREATGCSRCRARNEVRPITELVRALY